MEEHAKKLAKKGLMPSQIGVVLRDSHGVAQFKAVTGQKVLRLLKKAGLAPSLPEDLYHLIKKAVAIRKVRAARAAGGAARSCGVPCAWRAAARKAARSRLPPPTPCLCPPPSPPRAAPGAQPQRQGLQVPPDSGRVAYPPHCAVLQDEPRIAADVALRVGDCLDARRMSARARRRRNLNVVF